MLLYKTADQQATTTVSNGAIDSCGKNQKSNPGNREIHSLSEKDPDLLKKSPIPPAESPNKSAIVAEEKPGIVKYCVRNSVIYSIPPPGSPNKLRQYPSVV